MRHAVLGLVLVCATVLGGCSQGVLDPQGPIAAAERLLLINSTAIMRKRQGGQNRGNHDDERGGTALI
jgi:hypothetical protein